MFPSPAAQSFLINGRMHRVFERQASLVPATPGWEICGLSVTIQPARSHQSGANVPYQFSSTPSVFSTLMASFSDVATPQINVAFSGFGPPPIICA